MTNTTITKKMAKGTTVVMRTIGVILLIIGTIIATVTFSIANAVGLATSIILFVIPGLLLYYVGLAWKRKLIEKEEEEEEEKEETEED